MSIPDELMATYARLAAFRPAAECERLRAAIEAGSANPMDEKKRLAFEIVSRYHGAGEAAAARDYFERTVQRKEIPTDALPELRLGEAHRVADVIVRAGFAESKRAAERLISGNGVKVDGIVVSDPRAPWPASGPAVLSVGSRKFVRVLPGVEESHG
jgi:tyrosyl-tRNA synthetase